jgi:hypothetical protein
MTKEFHLNETLTALGLIAVLLFVGVSLIINTGKSCDITMQFIVLGANNETLSNDTIGNQSLLEIKYSCTKICIERFENQYSYINDCWKQCNSLGG